MARQRSQKTLEQIATAALTEFTRLGYRNAQMSDIARCAKLSVGTLYLYVESKEALFRLALSTAGGDELPPISNGPVPVGSLEEAFAEMTRRSREAEFCPLLASAIKRAQPEASIEIELRSLFEELFDTVYSSRHRVKLIERCAHDWPELTEQWYGRARQSFIENWVTYLESRVGDGCIRPIPDTRVAARYVIETVAWFAMHRFGDYDGARLSDEGVRATIVDLLINSFANSKVPSGTSA